MEEEDDEEEDEEEDEEDGYINADGFELETLATDHHSYYQHQDGKENSGYLILLLLSSLTASGADILF